ncbi:glycerol kinase GlpK [Gaiella sp.]|uniref:FGGY family carbohydrate kinase n=1 Tax=Gaiella sp. TaxID=2663207 RepID=UPI002C2CE617|nr:glycerol kinase GlpK [Gaiella sp.]HWO81428.1 glycerol kinase GlpK [Gaiella sp.]
MRTLTRLVILAIDQGTTGTTCLVVDESLRPVGRGYREITQHFPRPGWVEHDPEEIWRSVEDGAREALDDAGIAASELRAIGIANQRETTIVWERRAGRPVGPAIVWQDRRTAARCAELPAELVRERTGLVPDPYFSATKLEWLLRRCDVPQTELAFGTVDAWLVWKLTGGSTHATDLTNASRTMLLDLASGEWDDELLGAFGVERSILPSVVASSGVVAEGTLLGASVPIAGIAGDQQAALFGQGCHAAGQAKVTYGTGTFVLVNLGETTGPVGEGVLRTAVAVTPGAPRQMAAEGAVLVGGAALEWLRDGLGLIGDAAESERLAAEVESTEGVHFVPALTGLGSPQWRPDARGLITGLTRGTNRAHVVRAALEAIAHQVADVVDALPLRLDLLRADGGATANRFLMQFQADLLGSEVHVSAESEATALGAAALAGLGVGVWRGPAEVRRLIPAGTSYEPRMRHDEAAALRTAWRSALARAL